MRHRADMRPATNSIAVPLLEKCPGLAPASRPPRRLRTLAKVGTLLPTVTLYFPHPFLFPRGDHCDHWSLLRPAWFRPLLPRAGRAYSLSLFSALRSLRRRRRRDSVLRRWLALAAIPAASDGAIGRVAAGAREVAEALRGSWNIPVRHLRRRAGSVFSFPEARRDILAIDLFDGCSRRSGFVMLIEISRRSAALTTFASSACASALIFTEGCFVLRGFFFSRLFRDRSAAPYFQ